MSPFMCGCFCVAISVWMFLYSHFCADVSVSSFMCGCFCVAISVRMFLCLHFCADVSVSSFMCRCFSVAICLQRDCADHCMFCGHFTLTIPYCRCVVLWQALSSNCEDEITPIIRFANMDINKSPVLLEACQDEVCMISSPSCCLYS